MSISITNATQLSTFTTVRTILLKDATLNTNVGTAKVYQFEPKSKAASFTTFPYIVVNTPSISNNDVPVLNRTSKVKSFDIIIELVMEWSARANVESYCNKIISIVESNVADLKALGYYDAEIVLDDINDEEVMNSKEVIRSTFTLTVRGNVLI